MLIRAFTTWQEPGESRTETSSPELEGSLTDERAETLRGVVARVCRYFIQLNLLEDFARNDLKRESLSDLPEIFSGCETHCCWWKCHC